MALVGPVGLFQDAEVTSVLVSHQGRISLWIGTRSKVRLIESEKSPAAEEACQCWLSLIALF